jgi:hypothetical protein
MRKETLGIGIVLGLIVVGAVCWLVATPAVLGSG